MKQILACISQKMLFFRLNWAFEKCVNYFNVKYYLFNANYRLFNLCIHA